jgi:hypothetical protein
MQLMAELTREKKLRPGLTGKEMGRFKYQRQQWTEQAALQSNPAAMSQVDSHLLRRCRLKLATGLLDRIG